MSLPCTLKEALQPLTIITGHYGVGKTNFALNLALDLAREGYQIQVVDLDIVNPYFRSSEYTNLLEQAGVQLIAPVMAKSSLDTPSLSAAVDGSLEWCKKDRRFTIIDVGGDDAGATALGRYAAPIASGPYAMLYVVNAYRNLTQDPAETVTILREIESASHLHATGIVNNSHLRTETDEGTISSSRDFGVKASAMVGLPLVAQTIPNWCEDRLKAESKRDIDYSVQMLVKTPWE